jgi:purine-binding chemotaxis protein CheW
MTTVATNEATSTEQQLVSFDLATESYGVDIGAVREIIRLQKITNVPRTPEFVEGVINLRGKVIPVVDLRKRFGLPVGDQSAENRIVVVDIGGQDIGVIVDAVNEVLRIFSDSVEPPSSVITTADPDYLMGIAKVDNKLLILLDLESVLSAEERAVLADV